MTSYEFERVADGARVEADFPFGQAPHLGEVVELAGHGACRRVMPELQGRAEPDRRHISRSLPPWVPGAPRYVTDPRSLDYGQPVFYTKAEIERFEANVPSSRYRVQS